MQRKSDRHDAFHLARADMKELLVSMKRPGSSDSVVRCDAYLTGAEHSMASDDRVEVALSSDERFACGLQVAVASMAMHMPPEVTLSVNVLDGGIHDDTFEAFAEKVRGIHARTEFHRLPINEDVFAAYPSWGGGSRMTYARLLLVDLLPGIDHVIYCDADYIWLRDVTELWKMRDDAVIFQSTRDGVQETEQKERAWCSRNGLHFCGDHYFCAGLSFYNLRLFREERIVRQVNDFLAAHPDVPYVDQTAMNAVLGDRVRLVPQIWQRFSRDVTNAELEAGCAIHFADEIPWREPGPWVNAITDTMLIWHQVNARLYGTTVWQSLRRRYGAVEIVWRRLLFHIASTRGVRNLFFLFLRLTGRGGCIRHFRTWCRHLKWKGTFCA